MMKVSDLKIQKCLADTFEHVKHVNHYIHLFVRELLDRADTHDDSKFEEPELSIFAELNGELEKTPYYAEDGKNMSEEYKDLLEKAKPALDHHYSCNRHHAQFHKNGIDDMDLVDLIELIADWNAATKRNKNGNIRKSIEINGSRYNISPQLLNILTNTVERYF